jgi:hypothetical protein
VVRGAWLHGNLYGRKEKMFGLLLSLLSLGHHDPSMTRVTGQWSRENDQVRTKGTLASSGSTDVVLCSAQYGGVSLNLSLPRVTPAER